MTLYSYINNNIERVKIEVENGIIPYSIITYRNIYARYDAYKKMGENTTVAILRIEEEFKMSESSIYKIIKRMESQLNESTDNKLQPVNDAGKDCGLLLSA